MWPDSFEQRLVAWHRLRGDLVSQPVQQRLLAINDWWWRAPMITHDISWHDPKAWPDPWRLLANPAYSDLARALGIAYTVIMIDEFMASDLELVRSKNHNLVVVGAGKYILNWCPGELLNISTHPIDPKHSITGIELQQKTGIK